MAKWKKGDVCQAGMASAAVFIMNDCVLEPQPDCPVLLGGMGYGDQVRNADIVPTGTRVLVLGSAKDFNLRAVIHSDFRTWLSFFDALVVVTDPEGHIGWCHENELEPLAVGTA